MKKQTLFLSLLLLLHSVVPVGYGIALALGWELRITGEQPFFLGMAVITLLGTVLLKRLGGSSGLVPVLYPVSILNGLACLWLTKSLIGIPCVAVSVLCCCTLFRELAQRNMGRKLVAALSVLLVLTLIALSALTAFVGVMSKTTVVMSVDSPDRAYTAQLIDADYGATGGDTLVRVWDNARTVDLGLVCLGPEHREVYRGRWGEFMDMTLSWQDENTLMINERAYPIG